MTSNLFNDSKFNKAIKVFKELFASYKLQILTLVLLGFLSGILEAVGINAVIPLLSIITNDSEIVSDSISHGVIEMFGNLGIPLSVSMMLFFIVALFIFKAITIIIFSYISEVITSTYQYNLRNKLLSGLLSAKWEFHIEQKIGHFEKVLDLMIDRTATLLMGMTKFIIISTAMLVYIIVALNLSLLITLTTLLFGFILLLLSKPMLYRTRQISSSYLNLRKEISHFINQSIIGMKTIKASSLGDKIVKKSNADFFAIKNFRIKLSILRSISTNLIQPVSFILIAGVFFIAHTEPGFSLAKFAVTIYLIHRIFSHFQQIIRSLHDLNANIPHAVNLMEFKSEIYANRETLTGSRDIIFNEAIIFNNVSYSYPNGLDVLRGLSFAIKRGEMVSFIGASGSGKTTTIDLILLLLEPSSGEILIDGLPIKNISLDKWRNNIGYFSQDIFLLDDTIENNIRFYDKKISIEKIIKAAKKANIHDYIETLPNKYKTKIGDRGITLSGGQRQRLALARVLCPEPSIIILDEATSALDQRTEDSIQKSIVELKGDTTIISIAHRISTVLPSDRVFVFEDGNLVESGSPSLLLKNPKSYLHSIGKSSFSL